MKNDKWVKLFITTETQTALMFIPATDVEGGVQVEASVMINGKLKSSLIYAGTDMDAAQDKFDGFTRDDATAFVAHVMASPDDAVVINDEEPRQVDPTKGSPGNPEIDGVSDEEVQGAFDALSSKELKGWTSCMKDKIVSHYGPEIESCTDGITHGNWEKILECMVTVLGITDPEVWIPEQIIIFGGWSIECIFGVEK